jgi:hypothetical protein
MLLSALRILQLEAVPPPDLAAVDEVAGHSGRRNA